MIANRVLTILAVALLLFIVYRRFSITERASKNEALLTLNLSTAAEGVYFDPIRTEETSEFLKLRPTEKVVLPQITVFQGFTANLKKLVAATAIEFRLLCAERGLVILFPLVIALSTFELAFYRVANEVPYAATYASKTANTLLLFLIGISVFYVGEALHRDREVRAASILWTTPVPNYALLLSKFIATLFLSISLALSVALTAIVIQLVRGHYPIDPLPYLITYSLILLPSLIFLNGASIALNILLRDKYLTYAVSIGIGAGMFYLYNLGYLHWLYNPLLYRLWSYADLIGGNQSTILLLRAYCVAVAVAFLAVAHVFFQRRLKSSL